MSGSKLPDLNRETRALGATKQRTTAQFCRSSDWTGGSQRLMVHRVAECRIHAVQGNWTEL